ncbi:DUF6948 domain-containing protein [Neisseria gonorrhoeae]|uniref:DUF6948 domain-containing protein n=1 Tax=Neisseria gonorrhoeae TaxID=485 RepID=UPI003C6DD189
MLKQKAGNEVILTKARRMYSWWAKESISLSGVARHGIRQDGSQIYMSLIPYGSRRLRLSQ